MIQKLKYHKIIPILRTQKQTTWVSIPELIAM